MKYALLILLVGACSVPVSSIEEPYTPSCPQTAFFGTTDPPATRDIKQATISAKRCKELYGPQSCLKVLTRKSEKIYHAICGNPE